MKMMNFIVQRPIFFLQVLFFITGALSLNILRAQTGPARVMINMNSGWEFSRKDSVQKASAWQKVDLPHTWNKDDVLDDEPGYYRDTCFYKKRFHIGNGLKGKEISFYFEGANQETEVFINGKKAGHHIGGYTGFSVPITSFLKFNGDNEIFVKVDNKYNQNIPPLTADFSFYGGIYRDVYLIANTRIHFSTDDYGSNGVYITTPFVSSQRAEVKIKSIIANNTQNETRITLVSSIVDKRGVKVAESRSSMILLPGSNENVALQSISVKNPALWSPENPQLYKLTTSIIDEKGKLLDAVSNPLGFRWFSFNPDKGFSLNGKSYKLIGASRHQDYKGLGNAVPDSLAINDIVLLKKMGANFLRIAHYPQDPSVIRACDSLGILASIEIPIVNEITQSDTFYRNCELMLKEMIRQNFNHPSVIMWCYMNEVLLKPHFSNDKERQKIYIEDVTTLARRLEKVTRDEDPYRYTMMADHGNLNQYKSAGLLEIPMVIGWNLYSGWYGGSMDDFPTFLDKFHQNFPGKSFMVTEYGADADPRIRSADPVRFDKSIEYTTRFHQYYFMEMMKRPFVAGSVVWNLADFNSETRNETMPHMNNKGLLEWDRKPKDPYYFYQAILSKKPFVKILGPCPDRFDTINNDLTLCYQTVQVASNLDSVAIQLNGSHSSVIKITNGLGELKVLLRQGNNTLVAEGKKNNRTVSDTVSTRIYLQPPCLTKDLLSFRQINIMLGTARYFIDQDGRWWQPDHIYQKGGWGSIGGKRFKVTENGPLPYGTDKNIRGTDDDPLYQTQQTGIKQYRLDVPPGRYEVTLHFAELLGKKVKLLPYNLNEEERNDKITRRIFNVEINGQVILDHFNIAEQYGLAKAVTKSAMVSVNKDEGIYIDFLPVEGEPVLNALQLKKLDIP